MSTFPDEPPLDCDVIMRGGITSGVIYPSAICELARTYRLRSVGGSSAGAIAAAAAAAAEYGRSGPRRADDPTAEPSGFHALQQLPDDITATTADGGSVLFGLFQPQRSTAALFRAFTAGLGMSGRRRAMRTASSLLRGFWAAALLGALPGAVLLVWALLAGGSSVVPAVLASLLVLLVGVTVGVAVSLLRCVGGAVPANGFGICSGMPGAVRDPGTQALTPWLHGRIQAIAGLSGATPLTFGQLAKAGVELQVMTSNLTRHQPMHMPWTHHEYFFDPAGWRELFPADVVGWMSRPEHAPTLPQGGRDARRTRLLREQARRRTPSLLPFPAREHLPVVVAARMSLSFPVLISAVPLYAVDFSRQHNRDARRDIGDDSEPVEDAAQRLPAPEFGVNWFSDGGIASNLPVHFFDSALPSRPTFAINLAPYPEDARASEDQADNVYLPTHNSGGLRRRWWPLPTTGLHGVAGFLSSVVATARLWVDDAQLVMPGYRDRVVTIHHTAEEGGMNLTMPKEVVDGLAARGTAGARKLVDRFAAPETGAVAHTAPAPRTEQPLDAPAGAAGMQVPVAGDGRGDGWDNHRWIRLRAATAGLEEWLADFHRGYHRDSRAGTPYRGLAGTDARDPLPSYQVTARRRETMNARVAALLALGEEWRQPPTDAFRDGAPRPTAPLRLSSGDLHTRLDDTDADGSAVPGVGDVAPADQGRPAHRTSG